VLRSQQQGEMLALLLGDPDRDQLCTALNAAEARLGRPVQATIRDPGWLESGTGSFHDTLTSRPMVKLALPAGLASRFSQSVRPAVPMIL
jgi:hypothetical protein